MIISGSAGRVGKCKELFQMTVNLATGEAKPDILKNEESHFSGDEDFMVSDRELLSPEERMSLLSQYDMDREAGLPSDLKSVLKIDTSMKGFL